MAWRIVPIVVGTFTVTPRDYRPLLKDVEVTVSIVRDDIGGKKWIGWIGENPQLGIRSRVSSRFPFSNSWRWNFRKLKRDVIENIDYMVDSFLVREVLDAVPDLKLVIEHWKGHVDPTKRPRRLQHR